MKKLRLLTTALLLVDLLILAGCTNNKEIDQIALNASIFATSQHLVVQNGDSVVWKNAIITIDDQYSLQFDYVPRGNQSIEFGKFIDEEGQSYQPGLLKLRKVTIRVPQFDGGKDGVFTW